MSAKTTSLHQASELLGRARSCYIGSHIRPDGDALGSLLGLSLAIARSGRRVAALLADPVPASYRFLPGADKICDQPPPWQADIGLVVDCDGLSRLGSLEPAFAALPVLVDIDHHQTDHVFGQVQLVDPSAAATGELVHRLLRELAMPIDAEVATCLYAAILTDTGRFCFGNTTARALRLAGELVEAGADPHLVAHRVYDERSVAAMHLLGSALARLSTELDGQLVDTALTQEDFAATGAQPSDTEGIIDHLRAVAGPRVALLLVQQDDHTTRASFRSDGSVDVSEIALRFGGGGHMMAAGCTVAGAPQDVRRLLTSAIAEFLSRGQADHAR
ncbi:MAG: bifunctional oligoribonuclease/PAP phosphatase NrnA [Armatimonadota bacterium]